MNRIAAQNVPTPATSYRSLSGAVFPHANPATVYAAASTAAATQNRLSTLRIVPPLAQSQRHFHDRCEVVLVLNAPRQLDVLLRRCGEFVARGEAPVQFRAGRQP